MGGLRSRCRRPTRRCWSGSLARRIPISPLLQQGRDPRQAFGRGYLVFYLIGIIVAAMTRLLHVPHDVHDLLGDDAAAAVWSTSTSRQRHRSCRSVHPRRADDPRRPAARHPAGVGADRGWLEHVSPTPRRRAEILPGSILATSEHHGFELFGIGGLLLLVGASVGVLGSGRRTAGTSPTLRRRLGRQPLPAGAWPGMTGHVTSSTTSTTSTASSSPSAACCSRTPRCDRSTPRSSTARSTAPGWLATRVVGGLRSARPAASRSYGLGIAAGLVLVLVAYLMIR